MDLLLARMMHRVSLAAPPSLIGSSTLTVGPEAPSNLLSLGLLDVLSRVRLALRHLVTPPSSERSEENRCILQTRAVEVSLWEGIVPRFYP